MLWYCMQCLDSAYNALTVHATHWQCMQCLESACNALKVHAMPWKCMQHLESARNALKVHAMPWKCMQCFGDALVMPWYCRRQLMSSSSAVYGIACNNLILHAMPLKCMQSLDSACNALVVHAMLWLWRQCLGSACCYFVADLFVFFSSRCIQWAKRAEEIGNLSWRGRHTKCEVDLPIKIKCLRFTKVLQSSLNLNQTYHFSLKIFFQHFACLFFSISPLPSIEIVVLEGECIYACRTIKMAKKWWC